MITSMPQPKASPDANPNPGPTPTPSPHPIASAAERRKVERALLTTSIGREHGFEPLRVEGTLPPDLRGTLLRNGPGQFEIFGQRIAHSFEADGLITAVRLDGRGAAGACRMTVSQGLVAERAAGRMLYGTALPWHKRFANAMRGRGKNTANTNVVAWQGRVLALMEAARPTELDVTAEDVVTLGETDLGAIGTAFSAHPHRVSSRSASYNFGVEYGRKTRIALYELPDAGPVRRLGEIPVDFAPMLHDFIATDRHLVFFVSPAAVHVPRMLLQLGNFRDLFRWRPERGTEIVVVPIDEPTRVVRFGVDAFYQWHFANAFERGGELVVDYVRYPDFATFGALAGDDQPTGLTDGKLHRAVIDPAARTFRSEPIFDRDVEFPRVHDDRQGRAHDVTWLSADAGQTLLALRAGGRSTEHRFAPDEHVSEPIFVPRAGATDEADGWVLALVTDPARARASIAILDGLRLGDGPVARAWFDHHVPVTFHGSWLPGR